MQYRIRNKKQAGWLIMALGVLLVAGTPSLRSPGIVSLRLLGVVGPVVLLSRLLGRRSSSALRIHDEFTDEELACGQRLTSLRRQAEEVESATRDVRNEFRRTFERLRVEREQLALECRLRELKAAMARERAVSYSIEAARWHRQLEPLLRELEWLETDFEAADAPQLERWVQVRLDRMNGLRQIGVRLQGRLRVDSEASSLGAGQTLANVLQRDLDQLARLRVDLLALRAELSTCGTPGESAQPDPEMLIHRLKGVLQRIRDRRLQRGGLHESTGAVLRRNRASRSGYPASVIIGRSDRCQGPQAAP